MTTSANPKLEASWSLIFAKQPSEFLFAGKTISVELILVDEENQVVKHGKDFVLPIEVTLLTHPAFTQVDAVERSKNVLEIPKNLVLNHSGSLALNFSINELSSEHGNQDFCLRAKVPENLFPVTHRSDHLDMTCEKIEEAVSNSFRVVSSMLLVTNKEEVPELWYKDQGGRENCISVMVTMSPFIFDTVPLRAFLVYEDGDAVYDPKNTLLNLHSDSLLTITKRRQEAVIKFRIENVSKNHQSKSFRLRVEASDAQHHAAVAPVSSSPIRVKSKPNPRKKRKNVNKQMTRKRSKLGSDKEVHNVPENDEIPSGLKGLPMVENPDNLNFSTVSRWCDSVKETLCQLHDISVRRNAIENKMWALLSSYPEVLKSLGILNAQSEFKGFDGSIDRHCSLNSLSSLNPSPSQIFKGFSSEIMISGSNSIEMMLNGLKCFAEKSQNLASANVSEAKEKEESNSDSSKLLHRLMKEYKSTK